MTKYRLKKDLPILKTGAIFELHDDDGYRWLSNDDTDISYHVDSIDNFDEWFEPMPDEWPQKDDAFWSISSDGTSFLDSWHNYTDDRRKMAIGNVFKTREAADRFAEYLKAIATVRQDEGVIDLQEVLDRLEAGSEYDDVYVYTIAYSFYLKRLAIVGAANFMSANTIWFDTEEHADASCKEHQDEWKIIANYDWSRE